MNGIQQLKRVALLGSLLITAFLCLGYRLADLQWLRHEELAEKARNNTGRTVIREALRGDIRDVRGNQLATSVFVKTVCADPSLITPYQREVAHAIAPVLGLDEAEVLAKLQHTLKTNQHGLVYTNKYVRLKYKVSVEKWAAVQQAMLAMELGVEETALSGTQRAFYYNLRTKSVYTAAVDDQLRLYPNGSQAAHILGYTVSSQDKEMGADVFNTTGATGIEATLNSMVTGVRGWRETENDRRSREMVQNRTRDVQPRPGHHVFLTIEAAIQNMVEVELIEAFKQHSPISVSAVVVRPRTGEILAMANLPTYDPNTVGNLRTQDYDRLRNRAVTDMAEPGSTFKIVVIAGALNDRLVKLQDSINCENGHFSYGGTTLHDHESYGSLSVEEIVAKSSNIGVAKIGIMMGPQRLYDYIKVFGFGSKTGIPLPGEVSGWTWEIKKWSKVSITHIPMGHEITTTPLQMVMAMSAIANHGQLMRPMMVDRIEDDQGRIIAKYPPTPGNRVIREDAARTMTTALKNVVSKDGTAALAALDHYVVAGKTGTAQKAIHGKYVKGKYFSSFIGFFPADEPELCISVVFDEPKGGSGFYGGQIAAPVFKRIAERAAAYLKIRPDRGEPEQQNNGAPGTGPTPKDNRTL